MIRSPLFLSFFFQTALSASQTATSLRPFTLLMHSMWFVPRPLKPIVAMRTPSFAPTTAAHDFAVQRDVASAAAAAAALDFTNDRRDRRGDRLAGWFIIALREWGDGRQGKRFRSPVYRRCLRRLKVDLRRGRAIPESSQ